jgi:2-polyprenyl-3-methyl-5-hydroxy-6-metoxy-1,4-benzoquinol methylase
MTEVKLDSSTRELGTRQVARLARAIFSDARGAIKYKQRLRPYICPFHVLVDHIPCNATLLDVGCGAGLFISLLAHLGRVQYAVGFDADRSAISAAQDISRTLSNSSRIRFEHRNAYEGWPEGLFDVVCLIDVMHHVSPDKQAGIIATAAKHLAEGGILLYKDMACRPLWRVWANRVHDLLSAGDWIHYAKMDDVIQWARLEGLNPVERGAMNMLWYGHEWCVFRARSSEKLG